MAKLRGQQEIATVETTCGMLLNELQSIWDEVGENEEERDRLLFEIEQECLEVYRRKVDLANRSRASLHQWIAEIHAQIVALAASLGDRPPLSQLENRSCTLKEQVAQLKPILEEMTQKKEDRIRVLQEVISQIQRIQCEICPSTPPMELSVDEKDLTQRKLEELQLQLQFLQKEKNDRLFKVISYVDTIHDMCALLGCDFYSAIREVHPTLDESVSSQVKSISNETISRLGSTIQSLRDEKKRRMQKIQELGTSLLELWNLMDTPLEEQHRFRNVTCNIAVSEHELVGQGALSLSVIEPAEIEVKRLESLKASKMKELVLKKRSEMEELCRKAHIIPDNCMLLDKSIASMDSGVVDPAELLAAIEEQIGYIKEEAFSRKEIMEKIEKWIAACEEESWLEEYNKDGNRYSATRGAHLNLKRAERARATVCKIPAMVETLILRTTAWEEENNRLFMYDGVRFLSTIEEYNILRLEKEDEKRRQRDQKKLHEQLVNEQETLFGSKSSPNGRTPLKKGVINHHPSRLMNTTPANRRISMGGAMLCQESPSVGRHNNIVTPTRTVASKDNRRMTQTPSTLVNRVILNDESNFPHHGTLNPKHRSGQEIDSRLIVNTQTRTPLSPVSTPGFRLNANNTEDHVSSTAGKSATNMLKTPLPTQPPLSRLAEEEDEENTTPLKQINSHHQQQVTTPITTAMIANTYQQSAFLSGPQRMHRPMPQEYSFEEKRLAFMCHQHYHHSPVSACR